MTTSQPNGDERVEASTWTPPDAVVPVMPPPSAEGLSLAPAAPAGRRLRLWWSLIVAIVALDQLTKWLISQNVPVFSSITVVPGLIDLVHVHNAGVAFGFLNDVEHPFRSMLTTALAVVALIGIIYYATHLNAEERMARLGLSLILGGAVGNLVDRSRQGYVVDFVDVYWRDWHFWAFNVADAAITVGAVLIFIELLLPRSHVPNPV